MASAAVAEPVRLHLFDVSNGLARKLSPVLLGKEVDGIWHTTVVVGGVDYSYGPPVKRAFANQGPLGRPDAVIELGTTSIPAADREEIIEALAKRFTEENYDLLLSNCTTFANELATILTGNGLPEDIMRQLEGLADTPLGEGIMKVMGGEAPPEGFFEEHGELLRDIFASMGGGERLQGLFGPALGGLAAFMRGCGGAAGGGSGLPAFMQGGGCGGRAGGGGPQFGGWGRGRGCGGWRRHQGGCCGRGCGKEQDAAAAAKVPTDGAGPSGVKPDDEHKADSKPQPQQQQEQDDMAEEVYTEVPSAAPAETAAATADEAVAAEVAEGDFVVVPGEGGTDEQGVGAMEH